MIRGIALCCILFLFANFTAFLWSVKFVERSPLESKTMIFAEKKGEGQKTVWRPYLLEVEQYIQHGYDVSWLLSSSWRAIRGLLGEYSPFFEILALRVWGMALNIPLLLVLLAVSFCEGRLAYHRKMAESENISSTIYHLAFKVGLSQLLIVGLYVSFPFGGVVPLLGEVPVTRLVDLFGVEMRVWLSNPLLWMFLTVPASLICVYKLAANFSRNI